MAQQTAVESLLSKLKEYVNPVASDRNSYLIRIPKSDMVNVIEQAKAMEKEQIKEAYNMGTWNKDEKYKNGEQYYNETYNK